MKRVWIALAILLATFTVTMCHSFYLTSFAQDVSSLLEAAEAAAEKGDWDKSHSLTETAKGKWEERDLYLHITLRHDETDAIRTGFQEVYEFIQCQEGGEYSAANARLIANLGLMAEAEQLTLKNIL